jgi:hypothetical protein
MVCTKCQSTRMRRIGRVGFLRRKLAPLFGYYPWRCSICGTVQLLRARGERMRTYDSPPAREDDLVHSSNEMHRRIAG